MLHQDWTLSSLQAINLDLKREKETSFKTLNITVGIFELDSVPVKSVVKMVPEEQEEQPHRVVWRAVITHQRYGCCSLVCGKICGANSTSDCLETLYTWTASIVNVPNTFCWATTHWTQSARVLWHVCITDGYLLVPAVGDDSGTSSSGLCEGNPCLV